MINYPEDMAQYSLRRIIEINTLPWLQMLSDRYGRIITLDNLPEKEISTLKESGFDLVWFMGVWKRSKLGREIFLNSNEVEFFRRDFETALPGYTEDDIYGSPYAIAEYEPDPLIGTWDGLERLKFLLNSNSMGLVLDFVPNHTAPDHPWVSNHPEFYIQADQNDYEKNPSHFTPLQVKGRTLFFARGRDPHFPPWSDTLQLNHFNAEMRMSLLEEIKKIARYCDGIRCDMAMLVLNDIFNWIWGWVKNKNVNHPQECEFWTMVRYSIPKTILIAEAYWDTEWTLQQLGFDFVYDKRLYDRLRYSSAYEIKLHLQADISFQKKLLRFIENHDEDRSTVAFERRKLKAAAVILSTLPGLQLYHYGQIQGHRVRIPLQLKRGLKEPEDPELVQFYQKLLEITGHSVFYRGHWSFINTIEAGIENILAYSWSTEKEAVLTVVNYSNNPVEAWIPLQDFPVKISHLTDMMDGTKLQISQDHLHIRLHEYGFRVLYGEF